MDKVAVKASLNFDPVANKICIKELTDQHSRSYLPGGEQLIKQQSSLYGMLSDAELEQH